MSSAQEENDFEPKTRIVTVLQDDLLFSLNEEDNSASLISAKKAKTSVIIIPRSVKYKSLEYVITSISPKAFDMLFQILSLDFAPDSEISSFEINSLTFSYIVSLTIPSSVVELKKDWCYSTQFLTDFKIMPNNKHFISYENEFILGKSNLECDEFDVLVFARRDIKIANIPFFIKIINSSAFNNCKKLQKVEFPSNSYLEIIDENAFSFTSIESIIFPSNLSQIKDYAFSYCRNLSMIKFQTNSKLERIGKNSFSESLIENILIPSNVSLIDECSFSQCKKLKKFEVETNSKLKEIGRYAFFQSSVESIIIPSNDVELKDGWCNSTSKLNEVKLNNERYSSYGKDFILYKSNPECDSFDVLIFARRNIEIAIIPSFVKRIDPFSFDQCNKLKEIKFSIDSKLEIIESNAFSNSSINNISIPSSVKELKEGWCMDTMNLTSFSIMPNNKYFISYENKFILGKSNPENDDFDVLIFARRDITEAIIPSNIKEIDAYAFHYCESLQKIEFQQNSELKIIGKYAFDNSSLSSISFPHHLIQISECCFSDCHNLRHIDIPKNSELKIIGQMAFFMSSIESISIPIKVTKICKSAFAYCDKLTNLNIPINSEIRIIEESAFSSCNFVEIFIPTHVNQIAKKTFHCCRKLSKINIPDNSELQTIENYAFFKTAIRSLCLTQNISFIDNDILAVCKDLQIIEFYCSSQIQLIDINMVDQSRNIVFLSPK